MSGIGVPAPIADLAKQAAVARAQQLLQHEKIAAAKASGKNADAASLAAERYTSRDVIVEADGSEHVR
ncbi:hypothetical protein AB4084_37070, partial [Lysobacter sp. 2RAB21]